MELEVSLLKLYFKQGETWRLTLFELKRFDIEADWVLLSVTYDNAKSKLAVIILG